MQLKVFSKPQELYFHSRKLHLLTEAELHLRTSRKTWANLAKTEQTSTERLTKKTNSRGWKPN